MIAPSPMVRPAAASDTSTPSRPAPNNGLRILVAEDNPLNQKLICAILESRGHRVEIVEDGFEAVEAVQRWHFDLVIMDYNMPRMDGLAAIRAIRELPGFDKHKPMVMLTAVRAREASADAKSAGADDFLEKPIDTTKLFDTISRLVGIAETERNEDKGSPG